MACVYSRNKVRQYSREPGSRRLSGYVVDVRANTSRVPEKVMEEIRERYTLPILYSTQEAAEGAAEDTQNLIDDDFAPNAFTVFVEYSDKVNPTKVTIR